MPAKEKFIIIDGNALVHRSFHALPTTMRTRSGQMVNAVYGFTTTLLKVLRDLAPEYLVVTFDLAAPTFRHQAYKAYKATRVKQPDELYEQIPIIKEVVAAFDIPIYEQEGFEADDVIATLVRHKEVEKMQSIIVTGDMDTLQLVDANTEVYTMHKGISDTVTYDVAQVKKRFDGLTPEQVVDYKALRGDPSDNIPGVKGIGEKGAISLLQEFGTLENIYKNIDSKKISDRYRTLLTEHKKEAFESKALCQLVDTVPITLDLTAAARRGFDLGKVVPLFQRLEFKSLISRLPKEGRRGQAPGQAALEFGATPAATGPTGDYILVADDETFTDFFKKLGQQKIFAVDTETSSLERFTSELLGISFSWKGGQAWYVAATKNRLEKLKPILEDEGIKKVGHNVKFDLEMLANAGIALRGIAFDTMIASYLINPGSRQHNLDGLVFTELGHEMQPITELIGTGKNQISLKSVPLPRVSNYSCEDADYTWQLVEPLTKQLEEKNNLGLLKKIELPLIPILADMERTGVQLDTKLLKSMSVSVGKKIDALEEKIFKLAGTKFNVASPLQLKEILFAKLSISTEGIGRTKTGLSTAAAELEKMKGKHKIIDLIIEFRELSKLKSTYLDSLPKLTDANNRVHTSFNQTVAATGRLSSSDPNLQNIPIRTELGQKIRTAFIAPRGLRLLSVDYSQIELRIVASLANDAKMIASFNKGEDIHTRTAAEIHQVPLERVTKEMRYAAKAVNFGIIYGQGATGLAQGTGIDRKRAKEFIERYFEIHAPIKKFLDETKAMAHEEGFVETWFGRRRYLPEINSNIPPIRAGAERMAINHPVQGTAADLMKLAMIEVSAGLKKISSRARLLLQVHDELVLEVPIDELAATAAFVKQSMESVYKLRAPVATHLAAGPSWGELKALD